MSPHLAETKSWICCITDQLKTSSLLLTLFWSPPTPEVNMSPFSLLGLPRWSPFSSPIQIEIDTFDFYLVSFCFTLHGKKCSKNIVCSESELISHTITLSLKSLHFYAGIDDFDILFGTECTNVPIFVDFVAYFICSLPPRWKSHFTPATATLNNSFTVKLFVDDTLKRFFSVTCLLRVLSLRPRDLAATFYKLLSGWLGRRKQGSDALHTWVDSVCWVPKAKLKSGLAEAAPTTAQLRDTNIYVEKPHTNTHTHTHTHKHIHARILGYAVALQKWLHLHGQAKNARPREDMK